MDLPDFALDHIIKTNPDITYQYVMFADYYYWRGMLILCVGEATHKTVLENRAVMYETLAREDTGRAYVSEAQYAVV